MRKQATLSRIATRKRVQTFTRRNPPILGKLYLELLKVGSSLIRKWV
jgi:hypothetical protein